MGSAKETALAEYSHHHNSQKFSRDTICHPFERAKSAALYQYKVMQSQNCKVVCLPPTITLPAIAENGSLGGILFCQDWNWTNCTYTVQPLNTCLVMTQLWNDSISSLGPDNGTVIIGYTYAPALFVSQIPTDFYAACSDTDCQGNETALVYPGSSNLTSIGWNDRISSLIALEI
ncbi:hypothetical protein JB92DRAFT_2824717 [Gautieria morchelliformis]|nr:hypothetical protein JB92DRAFT_2824717 [Gautieria morchelliformis]